MCVVITVEFQNKCDTEQVHENFLIHSHRHEELASGPAQQSRVSYTQTHEECSLQYAGGGSGFPLHNTIIYVNGMVFLCCKFKIEHFTMHFK